ncbi:hypothetical protein SAMD00019534_093440 [Acytostelium subglobosum LB1]|uniref:hypothetical protein n=1 Tax=Acytostelium subglobosum LB1 TaxID=1410327 RepID=UPI000644C8A6|nr:hypothetical protein SAMD00019534_093440 [Acytostelium subglobosum LB1]GAM26169.1 hypothetical protein SAMD00019534_093440 [Acytostelium subglobosum LB1]|eukprot:XP_012750723.1 hypothetical protein SAMD00019534_093440 [Acytostelium subglobosum LB1]
MSSMITGGGKSTFRSFYDSCIAPAFYMDYRSLAFGRVMVASYLLADIFFRALDADIHYTQWGQFPASMAAPLLEYRFTLHLFNGSYIFQLFMFAMAALFAFALLIGYHTRIAALLSYIMLASIQNRNVYVLDGSDDYNRMILFWFILLPSAKRFAVDAVRTQPTYTAQRIIRNRDVGTLGDKTMGGGAQPNQSHISLSTLGYMTQFTCIYLFTALLKHGDDWHVNLNAVYYSLNLREFNYGLTWTLLQYPDFLRFLTKATLLFEYLGPILMVSPVLNPYCRIFSILGFVGMHAGFGLCINIYLFIFIPMVAVSTYTPSLIWDYFDRVITSVRERHMLTIYYDSKANDVQQLHEDGIFVDESAQQHGEELKSRYFSVQFDGDIYCDYQAFVVLVSQSWLLWPLQSIVKTKPCCQFLSTICSAFVDLFNSRDSFGLKQRKQAINNTSGDKRSIGRILVTIVIPLIFILYVPYWNYNGYRRSLDATYPSPKFATWAYIFKADQWWGMFAPNPPKYSRWLAVPAQFENLQDVDLLNDLKQVDYVANPVYTFNSGQRQRNFLMSVIYHEEIRLNYGRFICRTWNINYPNEGYGKLKTFKIVLVQRLTREPGDDTPNDYFKEDIWTHTC